MCSATAMQRYIVIRALSTDFSELPIWSSQFDYLPSKTGGTEHKIKAGLAQKSD